MSYPKKDVSFPQKLITVKNTSYVLIAKRDKRHKKSDALLFEKLIEKNITNNAQNITISTTM